MSKDVESLVRWYREKRRNFGNDTYFDRSTRLKQKFLPYVDWDRADVLEKEKNFNINVLAELRRRIVDSKSPEFKASIPMIVLALKNRAEYISNQSDIYPMFIAILSFSFALFGKNREPLFQLATSLFILFAIAHMINTRINTRRELSHCRELINILELYEKKYSSTDRIENSLISATNISGGQPLCKQPVG